MAEEGNRGWRTHAVPLAAICAVFAVMAYLYGEIDHADQRDFRHYRSLDHHYYRPMGLASPGLAKVERPFVYRILAPWLAGLLPFPVQLSFHLLGGLFALSAAVLLYAFLLWSGARPWVAAPLSMVLLCNKWFIGYCLWNCYHAGDLLSLCCLLVALWAMLAGRWAVMGAAMLIGVLTRETALVMIPVGLVYLWETRKLAAAWKPFVAAVAPTVACFFVLRALIEPAEGITLWAAFLSYAPRKLTKLLELIYTFIKPFVPLTFVPLVYLGTTLDFFRARKHLVVLFAAVFATTLFGADRERLMGPTFVVFYPLIAAIFQKHVYPNRLVIGCTVGAAFVTSFGSWFGRYTLPNAAVTHVVQLAVLFAVTGLVWIHRVLARRQAA